MAHLGLIKAALLRQRSLYLLWIFSLCCAVTGLVIVDILRHSLSETVKLQGRKMLTADASLSARRKLLDTEVSQFKSALPADTVYSEMVELFAMVSSPTESRLALVRFIDDAFPLVGELNINSQSAKGAALSTEPKCWTDGDLLALMRLSVGDKVKIGGQEFTLAGVVDNDSSQTFRLGNMAPRLYLHQRYMSSTQLIQFGSTFTNTHFALLKAPAPEGLKVRLENKFQEPGVQISVPADMEQGALRGLRNLMDYLGLIGLVTLSLGWIGVYYLGRRWLSLERADAGVLKCLGLSVAEVRNLLILKLLFILIVGVALGGASSWFMAQAVAAWFKDSLPPDFTLVWSWKSTILLLLIGPLAGLLLMLQPIQSTASEQPLTLLDESSSPRFSKKSALGLALLISGLFLVLTFLQARSWKVTFVFIGSLIGAVGLIALVSFVGVQIVRRLRSHQASWPWHLASSIWVRRMPATVLLVTVSALAGLLSQLVPHLEKTLVGEMQEMEGLQRPGLFLFDIQDEQLDPLKAFLAEHKIEISQASPFIRGRILSVNSVAFERSKATEFETREEEVNARFRNRGVNLSYRENLSPSETILNGKTWSEMSREPTEISVEQAYADRLGLKLGDKLIFDVQGIEVAASIVSLRSVKWTSFEPNFFIQFPTGVLDLAPKTWIMTIKRHPTLNPAQIQNLITQKYSNVTSINVQETLDYITKLMARMSSGLKVASRLALALGLFVFLTILLFQLVSARTDWAQLRLLGLSRGRIWGLQVLTYGTLSILGTLIGSAISLVVTMNLARYAFNTSPRFDWPGMTQVLLVSLLISIIGLSWMGFRSRDPHSP